LSINNYHYFIRFQDNFPKDIYLTDKDEWKEADFLAMSFITNKYNMGLGISKQDSDGNFNSTFVNESKNQSSGKSEFSESSDCNFK